MKEEKSPIELDTRKRIYTEIAKSPGLHFRELLRRSGLVIGELQYHLDYLGKRDLIIEEKYRDYSRFFVKGGLNPDERKIFSFLRQEQVRKILFFLLQRKKSKHGRIVQEVGLSPSTVSWYLSRLVEAQIVDVKKKGRESYFSVYDPDMIAKLLISYRKSFLDKLVDSFIESWMGR